MKKNDGSTLFSFPIQSRKKVASDALKALDGDHMAIFRLYISALEGIEPRQKENLRRASSRMPSREHEFFEVSARLVDDGETSVEDRHFSKTVADEMTLSGYEITAAGVRKLLNESTAGAMMKGLHRRKSKKKNL